MRGFYVGGISGGEAEEREERAPELGPVVCEFGAGTNEESEDTRKGKEVGTVASQQMSTREESHRLTCINRRPASFSGCGSSRP